MRTNKPAHGGLRLASSSARPVFGPAQYANAAMTLPPSPAEYSSRIEGYARKIRQTSDVGDIITLLEDALRETRALHTANEVQLVRQQVVHAENRIERLKAELEMVNKLVREDQLTGALNRRGLDDALLRESARADRGGKPLCIALIDLDEGFRMMVNILECAPGAVAIGSRMRIVFRPTEGGVALPQGELI